MVYVKIKQDVSGGAEYLFNACWYLEDERAVALDGYGVNPYTVGQTHRQMMDVRRYFGKVSGNSLIHFIVSFDKLVFDERIACDYAKKIASYFYPQYQTLWCVHKKERYRREKVASFYHVHIIINSVSYLDGKKRLSCIVII